MQRYLCLSLAGASVLPLQRLSCSRGRLNPGRTDRLRPAQFCLLCPSTLPPLAGSPERTKAALRFQSPALLREQRTIGFRPRRLPRVHAGWERSFQHPYPTCPGSIGMFIAGSAAAGALWCQVLYTHPATAAAPTRFPPAPTLCLRKTGRHALGSWWGGQSSPLPQAHGCPEASKLAPSCKELRLGVSRGFSTRGN